MSKQMLKLIARIAENLPEMDPTTAQGWIENPQALKETLKEALCSPKEKVMKEKSSLLQFLDTTTIPATTSKFVAKEKFVINTKCDAPVKISYLGDNFTAWFLNGDGKIEDPISEQTLRYAKLRKASVDGPIIEELGGETKVETTLSEMFSLMEKQKHGEDGVLLNNGYVNIFYIKDQFGVLRAVDVGWCGGGWDVTAHSVEDEDEWNVGILVFSRN
jgi:hypothetical protein